MLVNSDSRWQQLASIKLRSTCCHQLCLLLLLLQTPEMNKESGKHRRHQCKGGTSFSRSGSHADVGAAAAAVRALPM
jgi:hypothetical protein